MERGSCTDPIGTHLGAMGPVGEGPWAAFWGNPGTHEGTWILHRAHGTWILHGARGTWILHKAHGIWILYVAHATWVLHGSMKPEGWMGVRVWAGGRAGDKRLGQRAQQCQNLLQQRNTYYSIRM